MDVRLANSLKRARTIQRSNIRQPTNIRDIGEASGPKYSSQFREARQISLENILERLLFQGQNSVKQIEEIRNWKTEQEQKKRAMESSDFPNYFCEIERSMNDDLTGLFPLGSPTDMETITYRGNEMESSENHCAQYGTSTNDSDTVMDDSEVRRRSNEQRLQDSRSVNKKAVKMSKKSKNIKQEREKRLEAIRRIFNEERARRETKNVPKNLKTLISTYLRSKLSERDLPLTRLDQLIKRCQVNYNNINTLESFLKEVKKDDEFRPLLIEFFRISVAIRFVLSSKSTRMKKKSDILYVMFNLRAFVNDETGCCRLTHLK